MSCLCPCYLAVTKFICGVHSFWMIANHLVMLSSWKFNFREKRMGVSMLINCCVVNTTTSNKVKQTLSCYWVALKQLYGYQKVRPWQLHKQSMIWYLCLLFGQCLAMLLDYLYVDYLLYRRQNVLDQYVILVLTCDFLFIFCLCACFLMFQFLCNAEVDIYVLARSRNGQVHIIVWSMFYVNWETNNMPLWNDDFSFLSCSNVFCTFQRNIIFVIGAKCCKFLFSSNNFHVIFQSEVFAVAFALLAAGAVILTLNVLLLVIASFSPALSTKHNHTNPCLCNALTSHRIEHFS